MMGVQPKTDGNTDKQTTESTEIRMQFTNDVIVPDGATVIDDLTGEAIPGTETEPVESVHTASIKGVTHTVVAPNHTLGKIRASALRSEHYVPVETHKNKQDVERGYVQIRYDRRV